jgi:hypothetical protein
MEDETRILVLPFLVVVVAGVVTILLYRWDRGGDSGGRRNSRAPASYRAGMMRGGMMGSGMMAVYAPGAVPITGDEARGPALDYARRYGTDITIGDLMTFTLNYYVVLQGPGNASIAEVLVDWYTGAVGPEPWPDMLRNTGEASAGGMRFDRASAEALARDFLSRYLPEATITESTTFPGYCTFDFGRNDRTEGMVSVQGSTGTLRVHTRQGQFVEE